MSSDTALALARLRALRTMPPLRPSDFGHLQEAAAVCGRALVPCGRRFVMSWQDGLSPAGTDVAVLRRLTPARAALFAVVLAQCWPDAENDPWPGLVTSRERVLVAAARLGIDTKHAVGALEVDFPAFGLTEATDGGLRLGPAVAAWTASELSALRRLHERLRAADR